MQKWRLSSTNIPRQNKTMYTNGYINLRKYIILDTKAEEGRKDRNCVQVIP